MNTSWMIPVWQQRMMTAEALKMATALSKAGEQADEEYAAARRALVDAQALVEAKRIEVTEKYQAFTKQCQTYRPEVLKKRETDDPVGYDLMSDDEKAEFNNNLMGDAAP